MKAQPVGADHAVTQELKHETGTARTPISSASSLTAASSYDSPTSTAPPNIQMNCPGKRDSSSGDGAQGSVRRRQAHDCRDAVQPTLRIASPRSTTPRRGPPHRPAQPVHPWDTRSQWPLSGSRSGACLATSRYGCRRSRRQVGVLEGICVAERGGDRESEEITNASDVSAGGVDLLQDAVLSESLELQLARFPGKVSADRCGSRCGLPATARVIGRSVHTSGACVRIQPGLRIPDERQIPSVE